MEEDKEQRKIKAKILIYGDIHLCSRNYGAHRNYPEESLYWFRNITATAEDIGATHIIGLGDFSYGRFNTLEYRKAVEDELKKQYELTSGNRYELKGNHDSATYGMTEYEYYIERGLMKESTNLQIGALNLSMIDNGKYIEGDIIPVEDNKVNIVLVHDFFKFDRTEVFEYGKAIGLDTFSKWYGIDYIIGGHIHSHSMFHGFINYANGARALHDTVVHYVGCPCRPAYNKKLIQDTGQYAIITIYEGEDLSKSDIKYDVTEFMLWDIEKSFNLVKKEDKEALQSLVHIDVSDIIDKLDGHKVMTGNPEDIIMGMGDIKIEYRNKAIELLRKVNS